MPHSHRASRSLSALAATASVLLLASCNAPSAPADGEESSTIDFAYPIANEDQDWYSALATRFMEENPGVTIEMTAYPLDGWGQTIQTQLQSGNGPDVFVVTAGSGQIASVSSLAQAGFLLPLGEELADSLPESIGSQYRSDGDFFGVPSSMQVSGIVFNSALAREHDIEITADSTFEDVLAHCEAAAGQGVALFGLAGAVAQNTGLLALELAASSVYGETPDWNEQRASGTVSFAESPEWRETLENVKALSDAQCFQPGAAGAGFDALTNGSAAGSLLGFFAPSSAAKTIGEASGGAVELEVLPFPAPDGTPTRMIVSSDEGVAGNAATKSPGLVERFLEWSALPEQSRAFAEVQGSIPFGSTEASDLLPQFAPVAVLLEDEDRTRPSPAAGWPNGGVFDALGSGVTGLLTGQLSVDDVLADMDAAWGE